MAVLKIHTYPDPVLRARAQEVKEVDKSILELIDNMVETMYTMPATIGLAANQVGQKLRIVVIDVTPKQKAHGLLTLINPKVTHGEDYRISREGCLSLPDYTANVKRAGKVTVRALNRNGEEIQVESDGIEAVCLQHEIDHLDGILFIDRVESIKTDVFRRKRYK